MAEMLMAGRYGGAVAGRGSVAERLQRGGAVAERLLRGGAVEERLQRGGAVAEMLLPGSFIGKTLQTVGAFPCEWRTRKRSAAGGWSELVILF